MTKPSLSCFVSDEAGISAALSAHFDHFILEDSKVAIRSFYDDFKSEGFNKFERLVSFCKNEASTTFASVERRHPISFSVNIDLLAHEADISKISACLEAAKKAGITTIRVQDPGLISLIRDIIPEAVVHFNQEIGNQNMLSISEYFNFAQRQTLSLELPCDEIKSTIDFCKSEHNKRPFFELQVQGPILIQYSYRRFLGEHPHYKNDDDAQTISVSATDYEYPGRDFHFYDNPHGHFMYVYFDRCLADYGEQLVDLNLDAWLIDHRNRSLDYLKASGKLYFNLMSITEPGSKPAHNSRVEVASELSSSSQAESASEFATDSGLELVSGLSDIVSNFKSQLKQSSPVPLRGGFFRANKTDQDRKWQAGYKDDPNFLGTIVDIEKPDAMLFRCFRDIDDIQSLPKLTAITPENKEKPFKLNGARPLANAPLPDGAENQASEVGRGAGVGGAEGRKLPSLQPKSEPASGDSALEAPLSLKKNELYVLPWQKGMVKKTKIFSKFLR